MLSKNKKKSLEMILAGIIILSTYSPDSARAAPTFNEETTVFSSRPVIVNIINAEAGTGYSKDLLKDVIGAFLEKSIDTTVSVIPFPRETKLQKTDPLALWLRLTADNNPDTFEIALNGYRFTQNEFISSTYKQMRYASEAQSVLINALNPLQDFILEKLVAAVTLSVPFNSYNRDTTLAVRPAGVKVLISKAEHNSRLLTLTQSDIERGYRENPNGVTEIFVDDIGIISSYGPVKVKPIREIINDIKEDILRDPSSDDPLLITIPLATLNKLGDQFRGYINEFSNSLKSMEEEGKVHFLLPREFYIAHHQGPGRYLVVRFDDERGAIKNIQHHRKLLDRASSLGISITDSVIPIGYGPAFHKPLNEDVQSIGFLRNRLEKGAIDMSLHGLYHFKEELLGLSTLENIDILREGLEELAIVKGGAVRSLVPPNNSFDQNTLKAMYELGMNTISADYSKHEDMLFGTDEFGIFHISNTFRFEKNWNFPFSYFNAREIQAQISPYHDGVIMIHTYTVDNEDKESEIMEFLLDAKKDPNTKLVSLKEYYDAVMPYSPSLELVQSFRRREALTQKKQRNLFDGVGTLEMLLLDDARKAWQFFEKNTVSESGMIYATAQDFGSRTVRQDFLNMWDIGSLLLGYTAANQIGIIAEEEFHKRVDSVLNFLENIELYKGRFPQQVYNITNGSVKNPGFDSIDVGRLLIGFHIVATHYPDLAERIKSIINAWKLQDAVIEGELHNSERGRHFKTHHFNYAPYALRGYSLWSVGHNSPFHTKKLDNMDDVMSYLEEVKSRGGIASEPNVLEGIELGYTHHSKILSDLLYMAQLRRFEKDGVLTSISQGPIDRKPWFIFPVYIIGNQQQPWNINSKHGMVEKSGRDLYSDFGFVSTKASFAWHVLRNDQYSNKLYQYVKEKALSERMGYLAGIYENNNKPIGVSDINTNAVILEAIWYKLRSNKPLIQK